MTVSAGKRMTLTEFLHFDNDTGTRYELVDGVLVDMGAESTNNTSIAMALAFCLMQQLGIPAYRLATKHWIQVRSTKDTARTPDLIVHSEASYAAIAGDPEALLKLTDPAPLLVVEVVSPGKPGTPNYDRDYIEKRQEYATRGIPEYWLIDPQRQVVMVLWIEAEAYQAVTYTGEDAIVSPTFPNLSLTVEQILRAGRS
ncbi:Uma2 family endonuclease [Kovacikia minuta CCNUW1]|uniref:Uma2 family endonuclease n=1 Tax=Kovacikia minuta TaxID=2931930 RepID=UPI001CCC7F15|nr:Uma2 family endonuclease [Kovacikia minuta]UBF25665.1 Uma2 family endonuclease [Kovacikia minuta CCNUW1]